MLALGVLVSHSTGELRSKCSYPPPPWAMPTRFAREAVTQSMRSGTKLAILMVCLAFAIVGTSGLASAGPTIPNPKSVTVCVLPSAPNCVKVADGLGGPDAVCLGNCP